MRKQIFLPTVLLATTLLFQSCIVKMKTIHDGQIGVKRSFGKVKERPISPGLKVFFMGTRIFKLDGTVQKSQISTQARTMDGVLLNPSLDITYQLIPEKAPQAFIKYGNAGWRELNVYSVFIRPQVESTLAQYIGNREAEGLYNVRRMEIKYEMMATLKPILEKEGIELVDIMVQNIGIDSRYRNLLSENALYEQRQKNLDYQIELKKKENELKAVIAQGNKVTNIIDAEGDKERTILMAEGDSAKYKIVGPQLSPILIEKEKVDAQREIGKSGKAEYIFIEK